MFISSERRSGDKYLKLNNWSLCSQNVNVILFETKIEITAKLYVHPASSLSGLISHNPNTCNELQ